MVKQFIGIHRKKQIEIYDLENLKTFFDEKIIDLQYTELRSGFETNTYEIIDEFGIRYLKLSLEEPMELFFTETEFGFCLKKLSFRFQTTDFNRQPKISYNPQKSNFHSLPRIVSDDDPLDQNLFQNKKVFKSNSMLQNNPFKINQQMVNKQPLTVKLQQRTIKNNNYNVTTNNTLSFSIDEEYISSDEDPDDDFETDEMMREKYDSKNIQNFICIHGNLPCNRQDGKMCTKIEKRIPMSFVKQPIKYINGRNSQKTQQTFPFALTAKFEQLRL